MQLLDKNQYYKLIEPLKAVTINHLFARSVIEDCIPGKVYVDNCVHPRTFYVVHPYGMSLLFGDRDNLKFNDSFRDYSLDIHKTRAKYEWMQAFPTEWDMVLVQLFKNHLIKSSDNKDNKGEGLIELNTRINFKFHPDRYIKNRQKQITNDCKILRTDKEAFEGMKGSVIPIYFWKSADDFVEKGVGFSLYSDNQLASTAYSAFIHDKKLEIGIETVEEYRGKGYATETCSALIDYCMENDYEPIWACKSENRGSYHLALKLGFEPCAEIPFYRLCK